MATKRIGNLSTTPTHWPSASFGIVQVVVVPAGCGRPDLRRHAPVLGLSAVLDETGVWRGAR
jgi:hypothetical protein